MLPTHENIKQDNNNRFVGEKGEGDKVLELPIEILQDDTGQVVENERTHQIRTLSSNNNTTTRLKRGPNPGNPLIPFHGSIKSPGYREVLILSLGS